MELDITPYFSAQITPCELSGSVAELGVRAGEITWSASCAASADLMILDDDEKREAFRSWVEQSGGWDAEEIAQWSDVELNALLLQWISGDLREMGVHEGDEAIEWATIEEQQADGAIPSNICRGVGGTILFCLY